MPLMPSMMRALKLLGSLCTPKPTSDWRERVQPTRARKRSSLRMQIALRIRTETMGWGLVREKRWMGRNGRTVEEGAEAGEHVAEEEDHRGGGGGGEGCEMVDAGREVGERRRGGMYWVDWEFRVGSVFEYERAQSLAVQPE
jgi:hypothetical protein